MSCAENTRCERSVTIMRKERQVFRWIAMDAIRAPRSVDTRTVAVHDVQLRAHTSDSKGDLA